MLKKMLLWLIIASQISIANTCELTTASAINFGVYRPLSRITNQTTGVIKVHCIVAANQYQLLLNNTQRQLVLTNGNYHLLYHLYIDPARNILWGNGTQGTAALNGNCNNQDCTYVIYGSMPAGQTNVAAGHYTGNVTVTLNY